MTSMTTTMIQLAVLAARTDDVDSVLRHVDAMQIALEMADQTATADALLSLADIIQDDGDAFLRIPEIALLGMKAAEQEPDSLVRLAKKAKAACRHARVGDNATLFEICVMATALSSWMAVTDTPHGLTLIRVEDALLEVGRTIGGISITRLTGKVVPAGY